MNYVSHEKIAKAAAEKRSDQLGVGLAVGGALGAVLTLIIAPAPGMIVAGAAISSALGGFLARTVMGNR